MSIELLPADKIIPKKYHARPNRCRCHPETCCCNDWAVYGPSGEKITTCYEEATAEMIATRMNSEGQS